MKHNLTDKLIKINLFLLSIIAAIFIGLNMMGYKSYSIKVDTLVPVFKTGDLVYAKEYETSSSDIYLRDGRKMTQSFIGKDIIRFPLLGYVKDFLDTNAGKTIIALSIISLIVTICKTNT